MIAIGTVSSVGADHLFGYVAVPSNERVFFMSEALALGLQLNEELVGTNVELEYHSTYKGPIASLILPVKYAELETANARPDARANQSGMSGNSITLDGDRTPKPLLLPDPASCG